MLFSLLFALQILGFGLCSEQDISDAILVTSQENSPETITVPLLKRRNEVYINIGVGNPVQAVKAKLDFQTYYSLFVDKDSNFFGKEGAFNGAYSISSDTIFDKKHNVTLEKDPSSTILGFYGESYVSIGNRSVKRHFLDITYQYPKNPSYIKKFYVDPKDSKGVTPGYLDYQKYESDGITNGFLGLEPRFKDTPPNGFFSNETSIMDFLGPDQMVTIDMRDGKSLFSLGNAINANENINWINSIESDTFEFIIEDVKIGEEKISIRDYGTTAVINPRYLDIYVEKSVSNVINHYASTILPGCRTNFPNVMFKTNYGSIGLKPESFLKPDGYYCNSNVKPIDSPYPSKKWIFGWSFNKGRAIVYDYKQSRVGFVDQEGY
ncbi:hypothetical protein BB559_003673 [Furculomyces boomerangus]|uniref:Peptidase A1 domain-containing protein n=2 Tax=Harpellales TaxID=61421 RepID=A0A2T9YJP0_9FUNG|nr:hypothetical protein BB559_003673 [Furculomyces boomerangus]PWA02861.1 hypothetical protein BB558_000983 [Smittium angustum]